MQSPGSRRRPAQPRQPLAAVELVAGNDIVRCILLLYAFTLPLLYDSTVLEVAGDIRATSTHLAAGLGALLLLAAAAIRGESIRVARLPLIGWLALLLAAWAAVTLIGSLNVYRGIQPLKNLLAQVTLAAVTAIVWNNQFAQRLLWALTLPALYLGALGAAQCVTWPNVDSMLLTWLMGSIIDPLLQHYPHVDTPGLWNPVTTFANKNLAASWAAMMVPLTLGLIVTSRQRAARLLAGAVLLSELLLLVLCRTRASWGALAGAGLISLVLIGLPGLRKPTASHIFWVAAAAAGCVYLVAWGSFLGSYGKFSLASASVQDRLAYNLNSLAMLRDYWPSGVGLGAFYTAYPKYHDAWMRTPEEAYDVYNRPQHAHDDFMQAFAEMGVPGGCLYAGILLCAIAYSHRCCGRDGTNEERRSLFVAASLLTIGINCLLDFPMQFPTAAGTVALLIGGMTRTYMTSTAHSKRRPKPGLEIRRFGISLLAVCAGFALAVFLADDWRFRNANQTLKMAATRIWGGRSDEEALRLVSLSREQYPYDPRIQEFVGTAYATYHGREQLPVELRIKELESAVRVDPWGPYLLLALAEVYLSVVEQSPSERVRGTALARAQEIYDRLKVVAGFSHLTQLLGGKIAYLRGDVCTSVALISRALQIHPGYAPALASLDQIRRSQQTQGCPEGER